MPGTTISPNMNLPVPVPGTEPGPDWANDLVADMYAIDSHDHSSGKGVPITPDGMDISADLPMGNNNLTEVRSVNFTAQGAPLALADDLGCLYVSGADLYYNDEAGNQVRITQSGSVTGSSGTITGLPSGTASASYSAGTFTFQSATSTPANMAVGPLIIGRNAASSKTVSLTPHAAQAANFDMVFPAALPGSTLPVTVDASGNMAFGPATGSGSVVLATSPTIVTPVLTTPAISGGTQASPAITTPTITTPAITGGTIASAAISSATITASTVTLTDGSAATPALSFSSDTNTGFYRVGSDEIGVSLGGTKYQSFLAQGILNTDGTNAQPAYSFTNDQDCGLYRVGANEMALAVNGTAVFKTLTTGNISVNGVSSGSTDGSSGFVKWKVFTGSLAAASNDTITSPGTILGAIGYSQNHATSTWQVMRANVTNLDDGATSCVNFRQTGSTTVIGIRNNDNGTTNNYTVTVFYQ